MPSNSPLCVLRIPSCVCPLYTLLCVPSLCVSSIYPPVCALYIPSCMCLPCVCPLYTLLCVPSLCVSSIYPPVCVLSIPSCVCLPCVCPLYTPPVCALYIPSCVCLPCVCPLYTPLCVQVALPSLDEPHMIQMSTPVKRKKRRISVSQVGRLSIIPKLDKSFSFFPEDDFVVSDI